MKLFIPILLSFFLVASVLAQTGSIVGVVQDARTQKPLVAADVLLPELKLGTTSDQDGEFLLENVPVGRHLIQVNYLGYQSYRDSVQVVAGKVVKLMVRLEVQEIPGQEIVVEATRARERETPVVFTNLSREYLQENYSVQDIPMLLTEIPNVYSYADAGNPMGYTYLKVRGFDQSRVGVMINGIPLNDPEDHQVYWVDMPDFVESVQDIQMQRGVGSSLYGVSTFGGSLNIQTTRYSSTAGPEVFMNYGSYQTRKYGAKVNTVLGEGKYFLHLRASRMISNGYRENAGTSLWSFFGSLVRYGKKSVTQINIYGGNEITHAAWEASPEDSLKQNHRHNPITYPNTIDNFSQPHVELHHSYRLNERWNFNNTFFYIHGKGYYETYKSGRNLWEYGIVPEDDGSESDLIRQKWVEKDQFGWVGQAVWKHPRGELTAGTYLSTFYSDHWGQVEWLQAPLEGFTPGQKYYQYRGRKNYLTTYLNELFRPVGNMTIMLNLYYQYIYFRFWHDPVANFQGKLRHAFTVEYSFFNPRLGVNYNFSKSFNMFGNVSLAQREPADRELYDTWQGPDDLGVHPLFKKSRPIVKNGKVDYVEWSDPIVKPEKLLDVEWGVGYARPNLLLKLNLFWMGFRNEIVPYSAVDEDGFPIRGNADQTIHRGVETSWLWRLPYSLEFSGNFSYNDNYYRKFIYYDYDWNTGQTVARDFSGNKIPGFPELLANLRLTYRRPSFTASLHFQQVGKQYLDNTQNEDRIVPAFRVVNVNFSYRLKNLLGTRSLQLTLQLNNVLNEKYYTAGYYDAWAGGNYYWPAAEFNWIAGLRWNL